MKLPHLNKKPIARKRIFVETPYSHYFKIRTKKFHTAKQLAFSLHFVFRRDQNHCSNLTSKIMKMCEQILKKRAPQYNSNSLNCKKTTMSPIIAAIASRLLKSTKNQSKIATSEQKTTSEKANFCSNTIFSLYFKISAKNFHAAKPLAFSIHFLFRRDQNHHSNLTLKKTAPQYNSDSLNCKKKLGALQ